jgi:hypothetical protein
MSDPSAHGNPYGEPANPYGQPAQAPVYGQPPAYGQPPVYGQPPAYGQPPDADKRPGTVTTAAVLTLVFSALSVVLFAIAAVALSVERNSFLEEIENEPGLEDISADDLFAVMMVLIGVFLVWSLVAIVLAVLVMRRSNVARILLVISAAMTALVSLLTILSVVTVVPLVAAVAVVVLLLTGRARDWFARRTEAPPMPMGTTQPWG